MAWPADGHAISLELTKQGEDINQRSPCNMYIAHRISHGTNVVVVSLQSNSSEQILLFADWLLTTTTFVSWDILWAMNMYEACLRTPGPRINQLAQLCTSIRKKMCNALALDLDGPRPKK